MVGTMKKVWALLSCAVVLAACSTQTEPKAKSEPTQKPEFEWTKVSPAQAGFDPKKLDKVITETQNLGSSCLVIVKDGKLVTEKYWRGETPTTRRPAFSVTKSVGSVLIGMAQDDGDLDVDQRASKYIREWQGTPSEKVTIRNLLSNDSGREWTEELDYGKLFSVENRTEFAVGLGQMAKPGTVWVYNNAAIQTLDRVLREATGERPYEMARDRLFVPLGMKNTRMANDASTKSTGIAEGLLSTCMDLARFGLMIEQDGTWQGEQIVSADWIKEATGKSSQKLNSAYGLLWWVNRSGTIRSWLDPGTSKPPVVQDRKQLVPGAPKDLFSAMGFGGQFVMIDPGSRTIVVRMGDPNVDGRLSEYGFSDAARVVTYALK